MCKSKGGKPVRKANIKCDLLEVCLQKKTISVSSKVNLILKAVGKLGNKINWRKMYKTNKSVK